MKVKDGFLALAVAAALGAPAAFAQQDSAVGSDAGSQSSASGAQPGQGAGSSAGMDRSAQFGSSERQEEGRTVTWGQGAGDVPPPVDQETVRSIQQALKERGQDIRVDGIWGRNTHQALQEFQRDQNLDGSGQIDADTLAALDLMGRRQSAALETQPAAEPQSSASVSAESDAATATGGGAAESTGTAEGAGTTESVGATEGTGSGDDKLGPQPERKQPDASSAMGTVGSDPEIPPSSDPTATGGTGGGNGGAGGGGGNGG